jgi:hypothetical protein
MFLVSLTTMTVALRGMTVLVNNGKERKYKSEMLPLEPANLLASALLTAHFFESRLFTLDSGVVTVECY